MGGCLAAPQAFPPGSPQWKAANPAWIGHSGYTGPVSHKVRIAVLDGGFDYNHPRLQKHLEPFPTPPETGSPYGLGLDVLGNDFFPSQIVLDPASSEDISPWLGSDQHGTHVAYLATLNNKDVGLLPIRVLPIAEEPGDLESENGEPISIMDLPEPVKEKLASRGLESVSKGLAFAAERGTDIVNMSLGWSLSEFSEAARTRILSKLKLDPAASLYVVAAGNENQDLREHYDCVPATLDLPDLLAVGALRRHELAEYTNRGRYVDAYIRGSDLHSMVPGGGRAHMSGSSMAAPLAAGLAAQLKLLNPALTPRELRAVILNTTELRNAKTGEALKDLPMMVPIPADTIREISFANARKRVSWLPTALAAEQRQWLTSPYDHGRSPH